MLKSLSIRNVVLIDRLDLDFADSFNVLSGETGAGKSVLLDSLGLLLGQRAETGLIRIGADKLSVSGVFELRDRTNPFFEICAENDLEIEDEIIIKRSLARDGKGKIFINDQPVTQRFLKEVGAYLVEIHGQFDNQGLLNPATHTNVLDRFGAYDQELNELKTAYRTYKEIYQKLQTAEENYNNAVREEENLRHWAEELRKASVQAGEAESLNQKRTILMQSEKIMEQLNTAYTALQGRDIGNLIQKAQGALDRANRLTDNRFADIAEALDTALVQFDEAVNLLEQASTEISVDAQGADQVEERLFALKALARKHQVDPDDLPTLLIDFEQKLSAIDKGGSDVMALQKELQTARRIYLDLAEKVRKLRQETAKRLDSAVMKELAPLKMERAVFQTELTVLPEAQWGEKGCDEVRFTVSTNPNSSRGPLNKIASGGELARFMLALKVNLAKQSSVETLIFDEVDAGIGGATAQAVGERLSRLAQAVQVLVVTHSPQVTALGDRNFKVRKTTVQNVTTTEVELLDIASKKEEIARMLSGEKITDEARAAAEALMKQ